MARILPAGRRLQNAVAGCLGRFDLDDSTRRDSLGRVKVGCSIKETPLSQSKIADDPRLDPRLKTILASFPSREVKSVSNREEILLQANTDEAKAMVAAATGSDTSTTRIQGMKKSSSAPNSPMAKAMPKMAAAPSG